MTTRLFALAGLGILMACGDSGIHDVPLKELSDAELDELCDEGIEFLNSDRDAQLQWCIVESSFRAGCDAAITFCRDGAPSPRKASCAHQPAAAVTCELTDSELGSACKFRMSFEDAVRATPCTPGVTFVSFLNEVNLKRGPCMRPSSCNVFSIALGGFFDDAGSER